MINVLILEDESYTREFIKKLVLEIPLVGDVYTATTANEVLDTIKDNSIDIVLLDIELDENEEMNGLDIAKIIRSTNLSTKFIFITGYWRYSLEAFSVHPFDYIVKPINIKKFKKTMEELTDIILKEKNKS